MHELQLTAIDARVRWLDFAGDGPPTVYLHGLGCTAASDFAHIAVHPALAGRRSILPDHLGFGFSDRPADFDYRIGSHATVTGALLDHIGLSKVDLIGHSMGGAIAIQLAATRPDLVRRLVIAEPNLHAGGGVFSRALAGRDPAMVGQIIERTAEPMFAARARLADPLALVRSAEGLIESTDPTPFELLGKLDCQITYLIGESSLPDEDPEMVAELGIPVVLVPAAGHNMTLDNPNGFAAAIAAALA